MCTCARIPANLQIHQSRMSRPSAGKARSRSGIFRMPQGILRVFLQKVLVSYHGAQSHECSKHFRFERDSKHFMTINYLCPRSNKRGLSHDVIIEINLSVHHEIYVPINKSWVQSTAVDYQQSVWLVALPQWRVNISLGVGIGVVLIVVAFSTREQDIYVTRYILMPCSRITKQHIATDWPLFSAW